MHNYRWNINMQQESLNNIMTDRYFIVKLRIRNIILQALCVTCQSRLNKNLQYVTTSGTAAIFALAIWACKILRVLTGLTQSGSRFQGVKFPKILAPPRDIWPEGSWYRHEGCWFEDIPGAARKWRDAGAGLQHAGEAEQGGECQDIPQHRMYYTRLD